MSDRIPVTEPLERRQSAGEICHGLLIGGRYRVERRLAQGGQAAIYLAVQEPLNRKVALKVLSVPVDATLEQVRDFQQRFLLEAKTLAALNHPNIVVVHDYGEVGDEYQAPTLQGAPAKAYFIAMEYVVGKRFNDLMREGSLTPTRTLQLVKQVSNALAYSHRNGVIHRDVKSSNVLITEDAEGNDLVKVVDFGIVRLMERTTTLTRKGDIIGSPHFMSPEQIQGESVDGRTDIYSLGVMLYCGLTGGYPFDGPHPAAIIVAALTRPIPTIEELPTTVNLLIADCLAKKSSARIQTMESLNERLTEVLVTGCLNDVTITQSTTAPVEHTEGTLHRTTVVNTPATATSKRRLDPWAMMTIGFALTAFLGLILFLVGLLLYDANPTNDEQTDNAFPVTATPTVDAPAISTTKAPSTTESEPDALPDNGSATSLSELDGTERSSTETVPQASDVSASSTESKPDNTTTSDKASSPTNETSSTQTKAMPAQQTKPVHEKSPSPPAQQDPPTDDNDASNTGLRDPWAE